MVKKQTIKNIKTVGKYVGVAAIAALASFASAKMTIDPIEVPVNVSVENPINVELNTSVIALTAEAEDLRAQIANMSDLPAEIIYENVTVEVPVDNGNLDLLLNHIYDNDGSIEYITEDLDDDEIDQIAERVIFVNEIKTLAVNAVDADGVDLLDDEMVNGTELDEDDVDRFKLDDDDDEIIVDDIDFEDKDATIIVTASFEQDEIDYVSSYEVTIRDGEVDDIDLISVDLE